MNKTRIVHCKKEPFDVYIGRPSKWENPFSHKNSKFAKYKTLNKKESLEKFEEYLLNNDKLMQSISELKGKILGCWCNNPNACHGQILIKYIYSKPLF